MRYELLKNKGRHSGSLQEICRNVFVFFAIMIHICICTVGIPTDKFIWELVVPSYLPSSQASPLYT